VKILKIGIAVALLVLAVVLPAVPYMHRDYIVIGQIQIPRDQALYVIAGIGGAIVGSWNPWGTADFGFWFMYLPLSIANPLTNTLLPIILEKVEIVNATAIRLYIRPEARWSDGTPITSRDVAFASYLTTQVFYGGPPGCWGFTLYEESPKTVLAIKQISWSLVNATVPKKLIDYVKTVGNFVEIAEEGPDYYVVTFNVTWSNTFDYIGCLQTLPMPAHIIEPIYNQGGADAVRAWANNEIGRQVVSGPYHVIYYDGTTVVLERIDDWWGKDIFGLPKPKYIVGIIYRDNPTAALALQAGDVDWASIFTPNVDQMFPYGVGTWFKKPPFFTFEGPIMLGINLRNPPLDNPLVRKAIAYAIPYRDIIEKAYSNYSVQAPISGINDYFPQFARYVDRDLCQEYWGTPDCRIKTDLTKATQLLDQAGLRDVNGDGWRDLPDGTPFTITCSVPFGWTDWMAACDMIVGNLQRIGINAKTFFPDYSVWWNNINNGQFDLVLMWTWGLFPDQLFNGIYGWLVWWWASITGYNVSLFQPIFYQGIYTPDINEKIAVARMLQRIWFEDLPAIPLFFAAHWYEHNTKMWTGFPNEDNPWWWPVTTYAWASGSLPLLFGIVRRGEVQTIPQWLKPENQISVDKYFNAVAQALMGITVTPTETPATTTPVQTPIAALTTTVTVVQTVTSTATFTSLATATSTTTVPAIDWATTAGVGVVLLVVGFAVGYLIKKPRK